VNTTARSTVAAFSTRIPVSLRRPFLIAEEGWVLDCHAAAKQESPMPLIRSLFALLGACSALAASPAAATNATGSWQEPQASPKTEFDELMRDYQRGFGAGPKTDAERVQYIGKSFQRHNELGTRLVALARRSAQDPIALEALIQAVWQVNTTPWPVEIVGSDTARAEALELLRRGHIASERLGAVCERVAGGFCREYETFLREVLAASPHRAVQAQACLGLAGFLANRRRRVELTSGSKQLAAEFAGLFGDDYLAELRGQDRAAVEAEVEALFERAARQYGDVTLADGSTAGERAKTSLFELRDLAIGKPAPDIAGPDQDGVRFALSDYRGKVVLLDFWHEL